MAGRSKYWRIPKVRLTGWISPIKIKVKVAAPQLKGFGSNDKGEKPVNGYRNCGYPLESRL